MDYLRSRTGEYDSLVEAVDLVPGLSDSLSKEQVTLFAVSNTSFAVAVASLNLARSQQQLPPLGIKDLNPVLLDSMLCCYIFNGLYPTDSISGDAAGLTLSSFKYGYNMHVLYQLTDASGYVGGGPEYLVFSDMNNTLVQTNWQNANTSAVNIQTANAVIHALANNHEFGFTKFSAKFLNN
jgi:hypothetical protein